MLVASFFDRWQVRYIDLSNPIRFTLSLTIGVAIKLKERGFLDIFALPESAEEFTRIIADTELFPRVLWEMSDQNCDYATFRVMVARSEQEPLWDAFRDEVFDFFQSPTRPAIVTLANAENDKPSVMPSRTQNSQTMSEERSESEELNEAGTQYGSSLESLGSILGNTLTVNLST